MFSKRRIFLRWFIIVSSFLILTLILWNTYLLFQTYKEEERDKMEIWSSAYQGINNANEETDVSFQGMVLSMNTTIPIIQTTASDSILQVTNVDEDVTKDKKAQYNLLGQLKTENEPIVIEHPSENQYLYYGNSSLVNKLKYYPLALIAILVLFGGVILSYFKASRVSAQNKLWAGMAKETAHQIGTPLSSLLGWVEIMRLDNVDEQTVTEVEKDVYRLQTIADRFSKIGSEPILTPLNIISETEKSYEYLKSRASKQITFYYQTNADEVIIPLNNVLHSWTIENLVKNAIDAIKGKGVIFINIKNTEKFIYINVIDSGKGIPKNMFRKIFEPGFSTKKRGWGLGLSLTKRIVEEYHNGVIRVVKSEIGKGTTIQIAYKKTSK
ncbi:sensor histidine kinase [Flavobacterium sp. I3-2]|uniref:sensor histidine kinase n=1 Tax=Flavobacterium sp. I3-2 TaxID=2748319 RepID=UPI0015A7BB13|nr:HAMP domain-containing sensor histidine kinase [Flavobacterium sp. I3-2]